MSVIEHATIKAGSQDLYDDLSLRLEWLGAMALQTANEEFGECREPIRAAYVECMRHLAAEAGDIVGLLRDRR